MFENGRKTNLILMPLLIFSTVMTCLHASAVPSPDSCDAIVGSSLKYATSWAPEHFSEPNEHNIKAFRYIIHTVDAALLRDKSLQDVYQYLADIASDKVRALSVSVIDQHHTATFGRIGFIIKAPDHSILATSSSDMGSSLFSQQRLSIENRNKLLAIYQQSFPVRPPAEILRKTKKNSYNELLLKTYGIEVIGIIQKQVGNDELKAIQALARKESLPIIALPVQ
jgi:hypothetical protein